MKILYFAWVRQKVGRSEDDLIPPAAVSTVSKLIDFLRAKGAGYDAAFSNTSLIRVAVNQQHVGFDAAVKADDEVAFFPPVTGG